MTWEILQGDCLEVINKIEPESIDACITDPPYGIDYQSAWRIDKSQWKPKIKNDKLPFIWFLYGAFKAVKEGGSLICFCRWDVQDAFKSAIEWSGFSVESQVIWDRGVHGMGDLKGSFAPRHDVIWFAVKGKFQFSGDRPMSVIKSKRVDPDKMLHPNEKPVGLMSYLVDAVTPRGGLVLDPFAGSGTTLLASEQMGRDSIGIEISEEYCETIKRRMANMQMTISNL